jgi:pyruvate,water dikinase
MTESRPMDEILKALQERAKELNCLYRIDEIVHDAERPLEELLRAVAEALPPGLQYPTHCVARFVLGDLDVCGAGFVETAWKLTAPIVISNRKVGELCIYYTQQMPRADEGPFLKEERKLIDAAADRVARAIQHRELTEVFGRMQIGHPPLDAVPRQDWSIILDLLRRTDQNLYNQVARKMLNHLSWSGIEEAKELLLSIAGPEEASEPGDENRPTRRSAPKDFEVISAETFQIAAVHLSEQELLNNIQTWIKEDRLNFLVLALESSNTSLPEIANALERYHHTGLDVRELSPAMHLGLKVSLIRRLLTDNLEFINTCRPWVEIDDFVDLVSHTILLPHSHGRVGGKGSGLLLARHVLRRSPEHRELLDGVKVPKTWYVPSDGLLQFLAYNNLDDVYNWKYRDLDEIRQEYPHMLQVFKSSRFPAEFVQGLSTALDDLGDRPLIVRSSSLLEDRAGSAFSGKYKSLFLANQGRKSDRLAALLDAIAEVYGSVFGPDPIQYRAERGLLEHHEEMGIMIQEVVGVRAGRYFLPSFAGVGFSHNELRWSPRIRRDDGLLRLVPGLGTRAVDRLADDYPILVAPGQPGLRVNVTPEEVYRYSPRKVDVINLETNSFETVDRHTLLKEAGGDLPGLTQIVSLYEHDMLRRPDGLDLRANEDHLVFTFEGLLTDTDFVPRMQAILKVLRKAQGMPVDIEFASDGRDLYLLQCRPQSHAADTAPAPIPRDLPPERVLFSADRYVSNGAVPDITHIVYVDPEGYSRLGDLSELRDVSRAVGSLNQILPKRQFILMGPGRWGSRGDVKLGVSVTYSDINNTAMLIEVARKKGNYVPDLSFGTHFFQDLIESGIRYLPLYPDDPGVVFNEPFFRKSENVLARLLPDLAYLADTVRVIDVPEATGGQVLRVLMNADLEEAVGVLAPPGVATVTLAALPSPAARSAEDHWRWRLRMAQKVASDLEPARFGVQAFYVFGSTKNASAGPGSDIDVIIHFRGTPQQLRELELWLEGWSLCLAEMNFLRTGYHSEGLLDVHLVTDEDLARQTSYAAKIGAITDAARPLTLGGPAAG